MEHSHRILMTFIFHHLPSNHSAAIQEKRFHRKVFRALLDITQAKRWQLQSTMLLAVDDALQERPYRSVYPVTETTSFRIKKISRNGVKFILTTTCEMLVADAILQKYEIIRMITSYAPSRDYHQTVSMSSIRHHRA